MQCLRFLYTLGYSGNSSVMIDDSSGSWMGQGEKSGWSMSRPGPSDDLLLVLVLGGGGSWLSSSWNLVSWSRMKLLRSFEAQYSTWAPSAKMYSLVISISFSCDVIWVGGFGVRERVL